MYKLSNETLWMGTRTGEKKGEIHLTKVKVDSFNCYLSAYFGWQEYSNEKYIIYMSFQVNSSHIWYVFARHSIEK